MVESLPDLGEPMDLVRFEKPDPNKDVPDPNKDVSVR
jgi:hypothetical protein